MIFYKFKNWFGSGVQLIDNNNTWQFYRVVDKDSDLWP